MIEYRSKSYKRYAGVKGIDYQKFVGSYQRKLSGKLMVERNWRCLDLGCGFGNFLAYLRKLGVEHVFGIDSSEEAIGVARKEFGSSKVICADVFEFMEKTEGEYELVSALDFVEHLRKDELFRLLVSLRKIHKLGGLLLLRTPNASAPFGMAARYNDITHEICFTPSSIRDVLGQSGYRVNAIWEDSAEPGTLVQTSHWVVWSLVRFVMRTINAAETGQWGDGILTRNMWILAQKL